jgi:hypothetical protein
LLVCEGTKTGFPTLATGEGVTTSNYSRKLEVVSVAAPVVSVLVLAATAAPVEASFSGRHGKITFESDRDGAFEIYNMNPDGSKPTNITNNAAEDQEPTWSTDGSRVAFRSTLRAGSKL